ncbi:MAG: 4-hydroxy-tetrahydrodipicolinate synthase [Cyanobacteria bacterium SZAS LIN-3]|nr:4-hydroxy-tetrahydrodipicolinate synthase [Cyanobacteria bacterium SZAS LIN-3]MBS2009240.1 4-hydroxy-tetrahydrodipicolinate synthase [Cyanobacteria bacterium SZAS TMP-1]
MFGRVLTAMVTPFDKNLKIDYPAVEKLVEHLIKTGSTTLVVAGTTGESPTLEKDEKKELLKAVIDIAKKRVKVVMGTGTNDTAKSIKTTQNAEELGADGALVVAPYYNKPSQAGLTAHFGEIAKSTKLPIIMYNIPGRTGITIGADTIVELSHKHKNIYAVKDSTGSVELSGDIAGHAREDFHIYSGDDYLTLPFLSVGACGVVSVASHFLGQEITRMQDAFFAGKLDVARAAHYEAMPLFKGLFAAPNPTCVKYGLSRLGICGETLRLPLVPLSDAQKKDMDTLLARYDLAKSLSLK